jgi:hypothetical protein
MFKIGLAITWVSTLAFGFSVGVRSEPLKQTVCFSGTALRGGGVEVNYLDILNPSTGKFNRFKSFGPIPKIEYGTKYTFYFVNNILVGVTSGCK